MTPPSDAAAGPVAVLANPVAGRGAHRAEIPAVLATLRSAGRSVRELSADDAAGALAAARDAVAGGASALVAVGGDGTVNLGLQAVAGTGVPFGAVPAGTGNDFAREIGFPVRVADAAAYLATALRTGATRTADLARAEVSDGSARWFGAVLAAGFDAIVNERANRMRWPRGPRKYDIAILAELARLRPRRYRLSVDGEVHDLDALLVAVGNTACYGGGMRVVPDADAGDGLVDIVVVGPIGRGTFVRIKPRVYAGTHVRHPAVTTYRGRVVEIDCPDIVAYVDGERTGALPVRITAHPHALTLLGA